MKVAVIGAGAGGLAAVKSCLEEGLEPECFERKDGLGGVWNYLPTPVEGQPSVIWSTVANISKESYCYSDFPCPDDFPNFLHHTKMIEYLKLYAERFDLERYIRYRTEVTEISQTEDFKTTGQWTVKVKDIVTGVETPKIFDAVLVCNGNHSKALMPQVDGSREFEGRQMHAHAYRSTKGFEGQRVVVVGFSNTAAEIAVELSHVCSQVYVSTRDGNWSVTRTIDGGLPISYVLVRRCYNALPRFIKSRILELKINSIFDHSLYGVKPRHSPDRQQGFICDGLHQLIASGRIAVKPLVSHLTKTSVAFVDGTAVENVDAIVYATGYYMDRSFIKHPSYEVRDGNETDLYKFVFAPDVKPHTMAIIGNVKPVNSVIPIIELQGRWAVQVFKRNKSLPSADQMTKAIHKRRQDIRTHCFNSPRNTTIVEYIDYMDEIAEEIGCKPNWIGLLASDPRLAMSVFFGECIPSQYRLRGPGACWPEARDTILNNRSRIMKAFQINRRGDSRDAEEDRSSPSSWFLFVGLALLLLAVYLLSCKF